MIFSFFYDFVLFLLTIYIYNVILCKKTSSSIRLIHEQTGAESSRFFCCRLQENLAEFVHIIAHLCSIRLCAYLFSVTVGFLCPKISDSVLTSIPHSSARVANVCLKE